MEQTNETKNNDCSDLKREVFDVSKYLNANIIKQIENNYRVIPQFENELYHIARKKHYSLTNNKLLRCRLKVKFEPDSKKRTEPIQFPKSSDMHFQLNNVKFLPDKNLDFRRKLTPLNGVDAYGPRPIPYDMQVRSFNQTHSGKGIPSWR